MSLSPGAMERLALQRHKYLASLPAKRERILACWQGIQVNGWKCECFGDLKTQVHRLAGSAGSYGLANLGAAAKDLDALLGSERKITVNATNIVELMDQLFFELDEAVCQFTTD